MFLIVFLLLTCRWQPYDLRLKTFLTMLSHWLSLFSFFFRVSDTVRSLISEESDFMDRESDFHAILTYEQHVIAHTTDHFGHFSCCK